MYEGGGEREVVGEGAGVRKFDLALRNVVQRVAIFS